MKYTTVGLSRRFYRSRRQRDGSACSACSARYLATVFAKLTSQDEAERVMDPAWESLESSAIGVIKKKKKEPWLLMHGYYDFCFVLYIKPSYHHHYLLLSLLL